MIQQRDGTVASHFFRSRRIFIYSITEAFRHQFDSSFLKEHASVTKYLLGLAFKFYATQL